MADGSAVTRPSLAERFYANPYLLLALATLGFGGNAVAGKAAVGQVGGLLAHRAPVHLGQAAGVALAMVGVIVVASNGSLMSLLKLQFNVGDLMMLAACVLYSGYAVALRSRGPGSGSALGFFFGLAAGAFVSSLPLLGIEIASGGLLPPTPKGWIVLLYAALAPSFVCQVFFIRAVALIGPSRAGLFINLVPVWGALLAVLILGERFGLHHAAGLGLVLIGIVLSERAAKRPAAA